MLRQRICLAELTVAPSHVQGGVPEELLQGEGVAAIAKVHDRAGMPERVGRAPHPR